MRAARLGRASDRPPSLTTMIDVTFLLLIFFLCTLRFRTLEGKLVSDLPHDAGAARRADPGEDVHVALAVIEPGERVERGTGRPWRAALATPFDWRGRAVGWRVAGRTLGSERALVEHLRRIHDAAPDLPVRLEVGEGVTYGEVVATLDAVTEAGLREVGFVARAGDRRSSTR